MVLKISNKEDEISKEAEIDLRTYAKYILKKGKMIEKREILACTKSKLIFLNKQIILQANETTIKQILFLFFKNLKKDGELGRRLIFDNK